jgi:hypothetical protein
MNTCEMLSGLIIILSICFLMSLNYKYEGFLTSCAKEPLYNKDSVIGSNQLIGAVYPPRAGPLHANILETNEDGQNNCCPRRPFIAIYSNAPYLKYFNAGDPSCPIS